MTDKTAKPTVKWWDRCDSILPGQWRCLNYINSKVAICHQHICILKRNDNTGLYRSAMLMLTNNSSKYKLPVYLPILYIYLYIRNHIWKYPILTMSSNLSTTTTIFRCLYPVANVFHIVPITCIFVFGGLAKFQPNRLLGAAICLAACTTWYRSASTPSAKSLCILWPFRNGWMRCFIIYGGLYWVIHNIKPKIITN